MSEQLSIEQRVAAGAAWLDEHFPGWERRIDLASLELRSSCRCVLGQLFPDQLENGFGYACSAYDLDRKVVVLGFDAEGGPGIFQEYKALDEAWIALVKERFDSGALSDAVGAEGE